MSLNVNNFASGVYRRLASTTGIVSWSFKTCYSFAPKQTVLMLVLGLLSGLSPVVLFMSIRGLIDTQIRLTEAGALNLSGLAPWLAMIFAVALVEAVVVVASKFSHSRLLAAAELHLTTEVLEQASRLQPAYFDLADNQDDLSELRGNVSERMVETLLWVVNMLIGSLQCLTMAAVLISVEPIVVLVVAPVFLPYLVYQRRLGKWRNHQETAQRQPRRWINYYINLLTERSSAAEIRLLGIAPHLIDKFRDMLSQLGDNGRRADWRDFTAGLTFALLALAGLLVVFFSVVSGAIAGEHSLGDVVIFAGCMVRIRTSLESLALSISWWGQHAPKMTTLQNFLLKDVASASAAAAQHPGFSPDVKFDGINFKYPGSTHYSLENISMEIKQGETIAIVGENGSGKSTLVKLLAGIYRDYDGTISLGGIDMRELPQDTVSQEVSFVFQEFGRYAATLADNIAYGNWDKFKAHPDRAESLAIKCGLADTIDNLPDGMNTMLGREFGNYDPSGGTWQKIAIARAFAHGGSLLVMDEPTASVDLRTEFDLFQQIGKLASGRTTILVTHRFSTVAVADRIFVLHQGHLVEQGTHEELLAENGRYAELYEFYAQGLRSSTTSELTL